MGRLMAMQTNLPISEAALQPPFVTALLNDPSCYDHEVASLQLIETHISWVILTGTFAYKIKKPVDMGFLNFSTLELRRQACINEVKLNRRLTSGMYLGVVAISGSPAQPRINDEDGKFEYAVKMYQFSPDATLDSLSSRGKLGNLQIDALAARIARFHLDECATAPAGSGWGKPEAILKPVMENFRILDENVGKHDRSLLAQLQGWSLSEHQRLSSLIHERKQLGMIRECHGDMHLGNIAWSDGRLIIFDCIEFSEELRWIDIMSEVAFCFMDLLHRQHQNLAFRFLNAWLEATGEYSGVALLRYYAVYRTMVRAKIAAMRPDGATELQECLQLAAQLIQPVQPQLWITHGLSGCGKTTLSQSILQDQGMLRLRSDVERKRLNGITATASSNREISTGIYSKKADRHTYEHLAQHTERLLVAGWPVIVDATFLARWQRDMFREIARRLMITFQILDIRAPLSTLRARIARRATQEQDASDADIRVLQRQIETAEALGSDELNDVMQQAVQQI